MLFGNELIMLTEGHMLYKHTQKSAKMFTSSVTQDTSENVIIHIPLLLLYLG